MGSLLSSNNVPNKTGKNKNLRINYTSTGRYSTPVIKPHSHRVNPKRRASTDVLDGNSKIYKEIFPPPIYKERNTISNIIPISQLNLDDSENKISLGESANLELNSNTILHNEASITNETNQDAMNTYDKNNLHNEYELNWVKTGEDIRRSYIAKLIHNRIWQPNKKEKDHNSLIIFDWDDTLLCTSFLTPNGIFSEDFKVTDKDNDRIRKLDSLVFSILRKSINKADTYIITNAAPGWVEYSAKRFYPEVAKLLDRVVIVSARGEYEKRYPGDSRQWKILAFLETLKNMDTNLVTNFICMGDSVIEMEAAHILASKFTKAYIKTIKFREAPKPEELYKQLNLVYDQFDQIFSAIKNLTIRVERKSKEKEDH